MKVHVVDGAAAAVLIPVDVEQVGIPRSKSLTGHARKKF